tara:strand:+ start:310 stop:450 length:141 start_codon:yes stop_codon:yes gene_type:complete
MFVQFLEIDGREGNATVLIATAVHGPGESQEYGFYNFMVYIPVLFA